MSLRLSEDFARNEKHTLLVRSWVAARARASTTRTLRLPCPRCEAATHNETSVSPSTSQSKEKVHTDFARVAPSRL